MGQNGSRMEGSWERVGREGKRLEEHGTSTMGLAKKNKQGTLGAERDGFM